MADTYTANLNLNKPEVGGSRDAWGEKLNSNMDIIDTEIKATNDEVALKVNRTGDTMTGSLKIGNLDPHATDWGSIRLNPGPNQATTGYIEFFNGDNPNTRLGYIGFAGATYFNIQVEGGRNLNLGSNYVYVNGPSLGGAWWAGNGDMYMPFKGKNLSTYMAQDVVNKAWTPGNTTLLGWSGAFANGVPTFNIQVDSSYGGSILTNTNLSAYFTMRRVDAGQVFNGAGAWADMPAPAYVSGVYVNDNGSHLVRGSYLQYYINGTYYTVY